MAFQHDVADEELYEKEILKNSSKNLQVVELYQDWCGPSKAVIPNFKRWIIDNPDAPVDFYTVNAGKISALANYDRCEPTFLLVKDGKVLEEIVGLQLPKLLKLIQQLSSGAVAAQRHSSDEY